MHQIEIVRLCALWDQGNTIDRESVMTVVELIDDPKVLDLLGAQARSQLPPQLAEQRAARAVSALKDAIQAARTLRKSERLKSIRDLRDKHVAHYLTEKADEAKKQPCADEAWRRKSDYRNFDSCR